jgi:tRNA nucleotidyltransferase (CCA-adding enzyme)
MGFRVLEHLGRVDAVGKSFGGFKLTLKDGVELDVSLPRRESKAGSGHRGFHVQADANMSIEEAAARRDFTMNAMAATVDGDVIDAFDGVTDIQGCVLRSTSERFADDPLRVLRGVQFASRLGFRMDSDTVGIAARMLPGFGSLSAERVWGEPSKWARGRRPEMGLDLLAQTGWVEAFPLLAALRDVPQDPVWHPEGPVDVHTRLAVQRAAEIARREQLDPESTEMLVLSVLLHDIGKPDTTDTRSGRIASHGHAARGSALSATFLRSLRAPEHVVDAVSELVRAHMDHVGARPTGSTVRRLAQRLAIVGTSVRLLVLLVEADASGRMTGYHSPRPSG